MWLRIGKFIKDIWAVIARNVVDTSPKGAINKVDILKVVRNALFVGTSASLLFVIENLAQNMLSSLAQGLAIAGLNMLTELTFKYIKNNEKKVEINGQQDAESKD